MTDAWKDKLYFGDNLGIMREHIADKSVDPICLDPPFNSKAMYNVLFGEKNEPQSRAQITAFEDTLSWDRAASDAHDEIVSRGAKVVIGR